jgi:hypothetical protein
MISSHRFIRQITSRRIVLSALIAVALSLATSAVADAGTTVVPPGGSFEQTPLPYSTSDTCGLLCTLSTTRQAEGSNHYLDSKYTSLAGIIGTSTGKTTITSPQFTWSQSTPSAIALAFDRRTALGSLTNLGGGVEFTVTLVDDTTSASSMIAAETLTASESTFHAFSTSVPAGDLVEGHSYHLVLSEEFVALLGVKSSASLDLDNVGLEVTPAPVRPTVGATTLSGLTEHSVAASTTLDLHGETATYGLEYGTSTSYGSSNPTQIIPAGSEGSQQVSSTLSGLTPGTGYHLRFVVVSAGGTTYGPDVAFTTAAATPPTIGTPAVGSITGSGAIVSAAINPGASDTGVHIVYGTTTAYGLSTTTQTIPGGSGATGVQIQLSGLTPSTTYHAKVLATNADGSSESQDLTFTTSSGTTSAAPEIGPSWASGIQEHSASLETTVNTHGEAATYDVEYGTSTAYGTTSTPQNITAGSSIAQTTTTLLAGLLPGTTYHARFVVADIGGTSFGMDVVFTTAPATPPVVSSASIGTVSDTGATISATVNPGNSSTTVHVDYGTSTSYGQSTTTQIVAGGSGSTVVQFTVSGLNPTSSYHAVVLASNADGAAESHDLTFTTGTEGSGTGEPPSITATSVDQQASQSAVAHATIDSRGVAAKYEVQYGPSTGYGSTTTVRTLSAASGGRPVAVSIEGLTPGSLYHARFRVITEGGTSLGPDIAFTTPTSTTNPTQEPTSPVATTTQTVIVSTPPTIACLRVQAKRRGVAVHLLSLPGIAEISPSHPLRVTLAGAAKSARRLRYSIGSAPLVTATHRYLTVTPSQIQAGRGTTVRLLVTMANRKTRTLRLTLVASECGVRLLYNRAGTRAQVILRRLTASRRVTLAVPAALGNPNQLTLVTTSKNRAFHIDATHHGLLLSPYAARVHVQRHGDTITVTGLGSQITGLLLRFKAHRMAGGSVLARIVSSGGHTQSLRVATN